MYEATYEGEEIFVTFETTEVRVATPNGTEYEPDLSSAKIVSLRLLGNEIEPKSLGQAAVTALKKLAYEVEWT